MKIYHLEDWTVRCFDSPYTAPERRKMQLTGLRVEDKKYIQTSPIVKIDGKKIYTRSGSIYILGKVNLEYKNWLILNKIKFDPNNPIKEKHYDFL